MIDKIVFLAILIAGWFVSYQLAIRRVRRELTPGAKLLDERLQSIKGGFLKPTMLQGHFCGRSISIRFWRGRWRTIGSLLISFLCSSPMSFSIYKASGIRGFGGRPGEPIGNLEVGDPDLDQYGLITSEPNRFRAWVTRPGTKENLVLLMSSREWCHIELQDRRLDFTDYTYRKGELESAETRRSLEVLAELASTLETEAKPVATTSV